MAQIGKKLGKSQQHKGFGKKLLKEALNLKGNLEAEGFSVLVDDRDEAAGVKFNDAYLIGTPYILIMGKKYLSNKIIDLEARKTESKKSFNKEKLINFLRKEYGR